MNQHSKIKEEFLHEPAPIPLSALATNFAKIGAYIHNTEHESLIRHLVDELRFFIDWTVPSLPNFEQQYQLAQYSAVTSAPSFGILGYNLNQSPSLNV